jgi:VWFA-related protein
MRPSLIAVVACAVVAAVLHAQTPTFRSGVEIVSVDVTVLDQHRQPVRGLTAADFTVREDGKVRPLTAFTAVDLPPRIPASAPWVSDVAPDVATNAVARDGRLVVIFIASPIGPRMPLAKPIAMAAVDQLGPGDLAAVVYATRGVPQMFTADKARLKAVIDRPFFGLPEGDVEGRGECLCGVCTLDAMTEIADALRNVPQRRKSLVLIGTTLPIQSASPQCSGMVRESRTRLFRALDVSNLTVHAFDPSGLETLALNADSGGGNRPSPNRTPIVQAHLERQGNLQVLPDRTGGRTILNTNDPAGDVASVFDESRAYYVLGFPSGDTRQDGHFHSVEVKVNRRDVTVAARRGYYAPGGPLRGESSRAKDIPPPLLDAVDRMWPKTDLSLEAVAAAFANPGNARATVVVVAGAHARLDAAGMARAGSSGTVDVLAGAFNLQGHSTDYEHETLRFSQTPDSAMERSYEVFARLALTRGRHDVRVAVDDGVAGERGSVYAAVDVPDFAKEPLSIAGPLVQVAGLRDAAPPEAFADLIPIVPTTRREFARTDHVTTFARIYQSEGTPRPVRVVARLLDTTGHDVAGEDRSVPPAAFGANRSLDYTYDLPLEHLSPGDFLLTLRVSRGGAALDRNIRFRVR